MLKRIGTVIVLGLVFGCSSPVDGGGGEPVCEEPMDCEEGDAGSVEQTVVGFWERTTPSEYEQFLWVGDHGRGFSCSGDGESSFDFEYEGIHVTPTSGTTNIEFISLLSATALRLSGGDRANWQQIDYVRTSYYPDFCSERAYHDNLPGPGLRE